MRRRSSTRRTFAKTSSCVALVLIDGRARRKKEHALYKRRITELERETTRLKVFEEQDTQAYMMWIEREFAESLKVLRETSIKISELRELEHQVRTLASMRRVSLPLAYQEVVHARAAGTLDALFAPEPKGDEEANPFPEDDDPDFDEFLHEFKKMAEEAFGASFDDDMADERFQRGRDTGDRGWQARAETHSKGATHDGDAYLKSLYRQLVRVLHPDSGSPMTSERTRLWAEVQDAYTWGDVHRLQKLHASLCGDDASTKMRMDFGVMPIGDIIGLRKPIERRLRELRAKLRHAKQDMAWGFAALQRQGGKALTKLHGAMKREIEYEVHDARDFKASLERLFASWERGPKPKAKAPSGRGRRKRGAHRP